MVGSPDCCRAFESLESGLARFSSRLVCSLCGTAADVTLSVCQHRLERRPLRELQIQGSIPEFLQVESYR